MGYGEGPKYEVRCFYGSSDALEMGFGESHRLQIDFKSLPSIEESGETLCHFDFFNRVVSLTIPSPIGSS